MKILDFDVQDLGRSCALLDGRESTTGIGWSNLPTQILTDLRTRPIAEIALLIMLSNPATGCIGGLRRELQTGDTDLVEEETNDLVEGIGFYRKAVILRESLL